MDSSSVVGAMTSVPSACGTRTSSDWQALKKPPCGQADWKPSRQMSQVLSEKAKGAITRSPLLMLETESPICATTPIISCPMGEPLSDGFMEW